MSKETRCVGSVERRELVADATASRQIVGYAARFNSPTQIGSYFVEKIAPGAFASAIARPDDVRCLFNHSDNYVIGRTKSGTLRIAEDAQGLRYEADAPDTQWANDLLVSIERGDVSQSSFCFRATREEWDETGPLPVRTILEVELLDVSPVTFPAYDDTEVGLRSLNTLRESRHGRPIGADSPLLIRARMKSGLMDRRFSRL